MSDIIQTISIVLLLFLVIIWVTWVSFTLNSIKNKSSSPSVDFSKLFKDELTNLFSPKNPNPNALKNSLNEIKLSIATIPRQNPAFEAQISEILSKIKTSLVDIANQKSLYDEQKLVLSDKAAEILKLNEKLNSLNTSLSDLQKNYDNKVQEIYGINASHTAKLSEKDAEHAALTHAIRESNLKELERNKGIIDKHTDLHIPDFIKANLEEDIHKIYTDVILDHPAAISLWTSLGSFKSSCREGVSPEFTLQILKQLGVDVVKYFASSTDSNPQFTHQKLSKWADCFNAHSNERFNLFIPAIGAPVNNALMESSSGSAYSVTEVLCWGIRNPNGIVYSTALFR